MPIRTKCLKNMLAEYQRSLRAGKRDSFPSHGAFTKRQKQFIIRRLQQIIQRREARYGKGS